MVCALFAVCAPLCLSAVSPSVPLRATAGHEAANPRGSDTLHTRAREDAANERGWGLDSTVLCATIDGAVTPCDCVLRVRVSEISRDLPSRN
jgi:hypothetical protein